jgi:hypothetical protein
MNGEFARQPGYFTTAAEATMYLPPLRLSKILPVHLETILGDKEKDIR